MISYPTIGDCKGLIRKDIVAEHARAVAFNWPYETLRIRIYLNCLRENNSLDYTTFMVAFDEVFQEDSLKPLERIRE